MVNRLEAFTDGTIDYESRDRELETNRKYEAQEYQYKGRHLHRSRQSEHLSIAYTLSSLWPNLSIAVGMSRMVKGDRFESHHRLGRPRCLEW